MAGRTVSDADVKRGAAHVVLISHPAWIRRFGGDPAALGRTISLNGEPHTIIGILPEAFEFPLRGLADLWLPMPLRARPEAALLFLSASIALSSP